MDSFFLREFPISTPNHEFMVQFFALGPKNLKTPADALGIWVGTCNGIPLVSGDCPGQSSAGILLGKFS